MAKSLKEEFTKGIIKENPVLRLMLGTCATLAVTTADLERHRHGPCDDIRTRMFQRRYFSFQKIIPDKVRIPAYITIVAGFVTIVQLLIKAYVPALNKSLGVFLPLIVVNCIILGRAEMFASKNPVLPSIVDGLGSAFLGRITGGDALAIVNADVSGKLNSYNYVYPEFCVREIELLNMFGVSGNQADVPVLENDIYDENLTVCYSFLSGDEADYSGMAKCYAASSSKRVC